MRNEVDRLVDSFDLGDHDKIRISTVLSELAYNQLKYAGKGNIETRFCIEPPKRHIVITAKDKGPGIVDIDLALQDNYSTSGTLGLGLPGIKRLTDEFEITSVLNEGTTVKVVLWIQE
jgi:serine/threonine-protein kinase RsbT